MGCCFMSLSGKLLQALWVRIHLLLNLKTHGGEKYHKIQSS